MQPLVGLIMGSKSDWPTMEHAATMLEKLGVPYETKVVSAHRTPDLLFDYAKTAADRGLKVIIAGAGGNTAAIGDLTTLADLNAALGAITNETVGDERILIFNASTDAKAASWNPDKINLSFPG